MLAIRYFVCAACIALVSCSNSSRHGSDAERPLCLKQSAGGNVAIHGIYVFGGLQHGAAAVDETCANNVMDLHVAEVTKAPSSDNSSLLGNFRDAFYFSPKIKSGMFKVDGIGRVDPEKKEILIQEITAFHEVDRSERDRVFELIRANEE